MQYVYILKSLSRPEKFYSGMTNNLDRRLDEHNSPQNNGHTKRYQPWQIWTYTAFQCKKTAENFEIYLKTQAGRRFQKRRLQGVAS